MGALSGSKVKDPEQEQIQGRNTEALFINEYTVPNDATIIIVNGIRVSREFFSMLNDDANKGRYFKLKKSSKNNNGLPVIEAVYLKAGYKIKVEEE